MLAALGLAAFGWVGLALVPAAGMVATLAVATTAAVLAPMIPAPPAPGADLEPTFETVNNPYQRTSAVDFSRPPVNVVASMEGVDLRLRVTDGATGRPVDDLLVHDNALIHLVVVSPSGGMKHLHVTAPQPYRPGRYAAGHDGDRAVTFDITVVNRSDEPYDAVLTMVNATHGGRQVSRIYESANGGSENPAGTVLPGKSTTFTVALSLAETTGELQLEVTPGFLGEPAIFTGAGVIVTARRCPG